MKKLVIADRLDPIVAELFNGGASYPGFLSLLFFLPPDGSMGNMIVALASGIVAVVVAFIACTVILKKAYKEDV